MFYLLNNVVTMVRTSPVFYAHRWTCQNVAVVQTSFA